MLKKQKIMMLFMLSIGIIGIYNMSAMDKNKKVSISSNKNSNNISDTKTIITSNVDINEISDEILNIESDIQSKNNSINDLILKNETNNKKIKELRKELNNEKTINVFNNTNWFNLVNIINNYLKKNDAINLTKAKISTLEKDISDNDNSIRNLEIDIKNLTNKENDLKDFTSNSSGDSEDILNEISENIDLKLIDKIKKDKIDSNQENKDLLTTINIPEPSMDISSSLSSKSINGLPPFIMPVHGVITSEFGYRIHPISGVKKYHSGTDIGVDTGTPVLASNYGLVIYSGWYSGFGNTIILSHADGVYTLYGHNSKLLVEKGDKVNQGQPVALAGSTGYSTGPHCHFSMWIHDELVNPLDYVIDNK